MSHSQSKSTKQSVAFDPWLIWLAFRRHWVWAVPVGATLASVAASVVFLTFVPEYEAVQILQANKDFVLTKDLVDPQKDLSRSEKQLILSPIVMGDVLANPAMKSVPSLSDPLTNNREIRRRVKISNGGSPDLLLIGYRDRDIKQVAKVANAIGASYIQERRRFDALRLKNNIDSLSKPIEKFERDVTEDRKELVRLSREHTGVNPFSATGESQVDTGMLDRLLEKQFDFDIELKLLEDQVRTLQEVGVGQAPLSRGREIDARIHEGFEVKELRGKIDANLARIRKLEYDERVSQVTISPGVVRDLKKEVDAWNGQLEKLKTEARSKVEAELASEDDQRHKAAIEALQFKIRSVTAAKASINDEFVKEKERLGQYGGENAELYFARQRYEEHRKALDELSFRRIKLEAEMGKSTGSVVLRSAATEPYGPIEEVPLKKLLLAGIAAFAAPFFLAFGIELLAKRITSAESIDTNQLIPIMGEIARIPGRRKRSSVHRMFEESVDAMRANLLFKMEKVRTIAITSAMPGEGKSSVAFHLACSIARCSGENVLVVDADVRSPDQHNFFGLEQGPGLCKLLSDESMLDKCIDNNDDELVHLISAGALDTNPHNLLTKKRFEKFLEQVRGRYRYIVFDTAPVLPAAESLVVAAACDATLVCAMRDVSQSEQVERTFRRLHDSGANVIGTVFSGVPSRVYAYRYGDYRYV